MSSPVLGQADRQSAAWAKLKAHMEARLAMLRRRNDSDQTEYKTAKLRGRIAEVEAMLSLGSDQPTVEIDDDKFKD